MRDPQQQGSFGAKCAIHLERMATRTCARCGNFTCDECNAQGRESHCPTCRSLAGGDVFPFTRTNYSFDGIWSFAFEKWKQEWVMLSVVVLILLAAGFVALLFNSVFQAIATGLVGERAGTFGIFYVAFISSALSQVVSMIAQGAFQMGTIRILIDVLNGRKADVGRIMTQLPKLGRYVVQMFLIQLVILVPLFFYMLALLAVAAAVMGLSLSGDPGEWMRVFQGAGVAVLAGGFLLLIPVVFFVSLPLVFANMELVYGNSGPIESIRRAFQIANGFRFSILGFFVVALLIAILGLLACCVGLIPAWSLAYMLLVGLYLALRNGSGLPPPVES